MQLLANIISGLTLLVAAAIPIWIYIKTRSFPNLIFCAWGTIFAWTVLNCLAFPEILYALGSKDAYEYFPEGPAVMAGAMMGWMFGLELAVVVQIVRGIHWVFRRLFPNFTQADRPH